MVFAGFKYEVYERRRGRRNKLFHVFKAWKDMIRHKKYMMKQSVACFQFKKQNDTYIIKTCFDALKHNKEEEKKLEFTSYELNE